MLVSDDGAAVKSHGVRHGFVTQSLLRFDLKLSIVVDPTVFLLRTFHRPMIQL